MPTVLKGYYGPYETSLVLDGFTARGSQLPFYYFKISHGKFAGAPETSLDFKDDTAACKEMTAVCSDFIADVVRDCVPHSNWHMETLDEAKKAIFRISLVAESLT
jgi:hypothetical protein